MFEQVQTRIIIFYINFSLQITLKKRELIFTSEEDRFHLKTAESTLILKELIKKLIPTPIFIIVSRQSHPINLHLD